MNFSVSFYDVEFFLLILTRVATFVFIAPFFGMNNVPRRVKIGLSVFIAILLYYSVAKDFSFVSDSVWGYGFCVVKEAIAGLLIGFGANMCTSIVNFAGSVADMETGLSMVSLIDPATQQQTSITGVLYQYAFMLMLVATGMYRYLLGALADSFKLIPVGKVMVNASLLSESVIKFLADYILIGFRIILPIFCIMLLLNCVLGILAKVSPQLNMFAVGLQLKVLIGLGVLFITVGLLSNASELIFDEMKQIINSFAKALI
ncbi:MAG: flagellar biosynthetic protein FliR [Lachnospiraceae bacterium]|nr:flagellar biosynthetic protein FliR [Lachnospiraceae bacterium]